MNPEPPPLPPSDENATTATDEYQRIADTVGLVPSLRKMDNLMQGIVVLFGLILGGVIGFLVGDGNVTHTVVGLMAGMIIAALCSGLVLMVIGWIRSAR